MIIYCDILVVDSQIKLPSKCTLDHPQPQTGVFVSVFSSCCSDSQSQSIEMSSSSFPSLLLMPLSIWTTSQVHLPPPHVYLVPLPMFIWSPSSCLSGPPPHSHQFSSPNLSVSLPAFLIDQIHFSATISSRISTSSLRSPSALGTWNTITFKDGFKISIYRFTMVFKGISAMHF